MIENYRKSDVLPVVLFETFMNLKLDNQNEMVENLFLMMRTLNVRAAHEINLKSYKFELIEIPGV